MSAPRLPRTIPFGRIGDLRSRPDADLIAYTIPARTFADFRLKRYASRKALEAFCRDGSSHHALVKRPVHPSMLVNRNTQRAERTS